MIWSKPEVDAVEIMKTRRINHRIGIGMILHPEGNGHREER
jgi:hypothetical protein